MFFFCNSGAESVEGAIKLARFVKNRSGIIAFYGGFHGRTLGAASVTSSKVSYRSKQGPFVPDVYFATFPNTFRSNDKTESELISESIEDINRIFQHLAAPEEIAAILVEPVQGEGGYIFPPKKWLEMLRVVCDEHDILLIFDEVQTGFGRTGSWFAAEHYDVDPDIICMAKGIANGFPLGAIGASKEIMGQWGSVSHGTTFGGSPISCAAALATIQVIQQEKVLDSARNTGGKMIEELMKLKKETSVIGDVRGIGMMIGVEFIIPGTDNIPNSTAVKNILSTCLENGLLLYPCGYKNQTIRLIPPLTISSDEVKQGLDIFADAVKDESA